MSSMTLLLMAVLWLLGCVIVCGIRAADWRAQAPPEASSWAHFRKARLWSNVSSLLVGVGGTCLWLDGRLAAWFDGQLDAWLGPGQGADSAVLLSLPAGMAFTWVGRAVVKSWENWIASKTGVKPEED